MVRQALALKDKWNATHPHEWLVWEPGAWKVPATGEKLADTQHAPTRPFDRPPRGDCLCFELKCEPDAKISVGRAPENGIVINDATVSREHIGLERTPTGWNVTARRPCTLSGQELTPGTPAPVASGDRILMGGVTLTFLSATGFWERIHAEAQKLK